VFRGPLNLTQLQLPHNGIEDILIDLLIDIDVTKERVHMKHMHLSVHVQIVLLLPPIKVLAVVFTT